MTEPRSARTGIAMRPPSWWTGALVVLFLASLAWKVYCLRRLLSSPLSGDLSADSQAYWAWAQVLVRDGWVGHNPFFLGPLYPYLLALLRPTATSSCVGPLAAQCVLGAATVVLVALGSRTLCPPRYAIVAGVLTAGYAMATFMDLSILAESVLWFLGAVFLYMQLRALGRGSSRAFPAVSGLLVGLMSLARPSFMLLLAPHVVSAVSSRGMRRGLRSSAIAVACAIGVCLPVLLRHVALGHGWILNTYSLGFNAYVGNGPQATGAYSLIDDASNDDLAAVGIEGGVDGDGRDYIFRREGLRVSPLGSSAYWLRQTWVQVRTFPGRALRLLAWKSVLSFNHVEASQLDNIGVHERIEGPMGLPWLGSFGVAGVLGLFGLFLIRRTYPGQVLLAHAVAVWAPLVIFFVTDRYRHHLTLPLLVGSGPAIEAAWRGLGSLRSTNSRSVTTLLTLVTATGVVWLPLVRFNRQQVEFEVHAALGEALLRKGNFVEGEAELEKCVAPAMLSRLPLRRSAAARAAVASVLSYLGGSFAGRGLYPRSEQVLRAALGYAPGDRELRRDHATLLAINGMSGAAISELDTLRAPVALLERDLLRVAERAAGRGAWGAAERALRAAIEVDSTSEAANVVLLRLLRAQGREAEAGLLLARFAARGVTAAAR